VAKRRGNGEGSVYRRGDGRVVGEYVDANGKRRYVSGKSKTEVKAKLRKLLADRDKGIAYDSENLTVSGYLDRWLDAIRGTVRDRTWERHEQVVRLHLGPTIGNVRLDRLNALQVQSVYGRKLEAGLSPRSVEIIHTTLHKALKQAVGWTLIPRNVAEAAASGWEGDQAALTGAGAYAAGGRQGRQAARLLRPGRDHRDAKWRAARASMERC
jgi:integrase